jgi:uncharacterized protein (TIGR00251 family)
MGGSGKGRDRAARTGGGDASPAVVPGADGAGRADAARVAHGEQAPHWRWDGEDLVLELRAKPGARRDGFGRVAGGRLAVQVASVAEDGRANARLLAFLATAFGVAKSAVELAQGGASPLKRVRVRAPRSLPQAAGVSPRPG